MIAMALAFILSFQVGTGLYRDNFERWKALPPSQFA
jgi:hypothetical protein